MPPARQSADSVALHAGAAPPRLASVSAQDARGRWYVSFQFRCRRRRRASANRVLTVLKAALNRAWREGRLPSDAVWRRVEPFARVAAARVRYLKVAEA